MSTLTSQIPENTNSELLLDILRRFGITVGKYSDKAVVVTKSKTFYSNAKRHIIKPKSGVSATL